MTIYIERIYTDGCCFNNGQAGAAAGIGVYFGPGDNRNISQPLSGRQTNQRAEIAAVVLAVRHGDPDCALKIYTDSKYVVNSVNLYLRKWEQNDWINSNGSPVVNQDLFKKLSYEIDRYPYDVAIVSSQPGFTDIKKYIPSHSNIAGNECADLLAKKGARNSRQ
ncbi:hypothetical protein DSO57_1035695 [Entomophthora muscae]|uniref:Uncharacterized protein n=1 Tax=Entomophthora muscae TaxID=34485 RepID=A0ACC2RQH6_9FUNG|nr:hypothetical protein DSO57_1035695 [Entomophthora muscae]